MFFVLVWRLFSLPKHSFFIARARSKRSVDGPSQSIPKMVLVFDAHKVHKLHTSHSGCGVLSDKGFFVFGCNRFGSMGQGMAAEDLPAVRKPLEIEALKV